MYERRAMDVDVWQMSVSEMGDRCDLPCRSVGARPEEFRFKDHFVDDDT